MNLTTIFMTRTLNPSSNTWIYKTSFPTNRTEITKTAVEITLAIITETAEITLATATLTKIALAIITRINQPLTTTLIVAEATKDKTKERYNQVTLAQFIQTATTLGVNAFATQTTQIGLTETTRIIIIIIRVLEVTKTTMLMTSRLQMDIIANHVIHYHQMISFMLTAQLMTTISLMIFKDFQ